MLFAAGMVANLTLIAAATWLFPGSSVATAPRESEPVAGASAARAPFATHQIVTLICLLGLMFSVLTGFWLRLEPDIGVIAFGFGTRR